jgi:hypothetical protein
MDRILNSNGRTTIQKDERSTNPNIDNRRKGQFKRGWNAAVRRKNYKTKTLEILYWRNLGYRIGKLLGKTSETLQEEMYELCVRQQGERRNDD